MIGSSNSSWREAREKAQSQRTYVGASRRPVVQIDVEKRRLALKVPDSPVSRRKSLPGGVSFCPKGVNALAVAMAGVMDKQPPRRPATSSEYSSSTCSSSLKIRTLCTSVEDSLDSAGAFPQQKPSSFARDSQSVGRSSDASITTCSAPTMKKGLLSQRVARITSKPVKDAASYRNPSKRLSHTTGSELSVNSKEVEHNESSSPAPVLASAPVLQQWKLRETRNLESFRPSCVRSLVTDTAQSSIAPASLIETDPISNQQVCHENFVRRNLSKNKAASKYRAVPNLHKMKMQAREASRSEAKLGTKRFRGNNSSSPGLFDSSDSEIEKRDCGAHATCSADGSDAEDSTASSISTDGARPENMPVVVGGGLKVWGLDPLELSLQAIEQQASNQFSLANSVVRDSTRVKSDHSSMNTTTTDPSRKIRGINLEVSSKSLRKGPLNHINVCVESSSAPAASANYSDETLMNYAPNCTGHQMPAKLLTVKKSGRNKGKKFYGCTFPAEQRCDFFLWAEDNPALINVEDGSTAGNEGGFALRSYCDRLEMMTVAELKEECKRINATKRFIDTVHGDPVKLLKLGGNRQDVIARLKEEASLFLNARTTTSAATNFEISDVVMQLSGDDSDEDLSNGRYEERKQENISKKIKHGQSPPNSKDGDEVGVGDLHSILRLKFGLADFRPGQRWAVERALSGLNSLLVLPTGAGKSLTYQLPALMLPGLTIVVSPLISLMQDQIRKLPFHLPGVCFSGSMTAHQAAIISSAVLSRKVKVLYISPERLCTAAFRLLIKMLRQQSFDEPPVSLLCVDEAHCLSQWSYNFRPAFLRIRREIEFIRPRAVLALTATATSAVQADIRQHLSINGENSLLCLSTQRSNLILAALNVEEDSTKRENIVKLIKQNSSSYKQTQKRKRVDDDAGVTIVYVWRRSDADSLGEYLRACGIATAIYHAGMDVYQREKAQRQFDRGTARCIVATVAFGMGIDKANVRQVIHYTMPKSLENYLQETGRAGRDGAVAHCHLLFSKDDFFHQHALSYSNQCSRAQLLSLLLYLYGTDTDSSNRLKQGSTIPKMFAVNLELVEQTIDLPAAIVETILTLLELPPFNLVRVVGTHYNIVSGLFRLAPVKLKKIYENYRQRKMAHLISISNPSAADGKENYLGNSHEKGASSVVTDPLLEVLVSSVDRIDKYSTGYNKVPFQCSRLSLAMELDCTLDDIGRSLYRLQKEGLIEYKLTGSALLIENNVTDATTIHKIVCATREAVCASSADTYSGDNISFILPLVEILYEKLNEISTQAAQRVMEMYKCSLVMSSITGNTSENSMIESVATKLSTSRSCDTEITRDDNNKSCIETPIRVTVHQSDVQAFLCYIMGERNDDSRQSDTEKLSEQQKIMGSRYTSIPSPFPQDVSSCGHEQSQSEKRLVLEIRAVIMDGKLQSIVNNLCFKCLTSSDKTESFSARSLLFLPAGADSSTPEIESLSLRSIMNRMSSYRREMCALYVARVVHGLPTKALSMQQWSGSGCWAAYRPICSFPDVLALALQELVLIEKESLS